MDPGKSGKSRYRDFSYPCRGHILMNTGLQISVFQGLLVARCVGVRLNFLYQLLPLVFQFRRFQSLEIDFLIPRVIHLRSVKWNFTWIILARYTATLLMYKSRYEMSKVSSLCQRYQLLMGLYIVRSLFVLFPTVLSPVLRPLSEGYEFGFVGSAEPPIAR